MKKAVFFDFDGTIADSSEGIMECALKTVQPLGYDTSIYSKEYFQDGIHLSAGGIYMTAS